ncbi:response regulator transcription factor [Alkalihalobacillus sp. MEB130]|uniref:response regulator transcription factor n=1 Tax=Alkalihalobacillus sp. MEB130 TaxID=2976704 RepID=UPI0028DEC236|nr:response regulator transcription factor [Alkalihalobacillus sp. MEB130]MDT8860702.1 response regulator transcription factor [Alkalihalobacillus sp. MEB130]
MIKILIVDDEVIEREGLSLMISKERPAINIVGEAGNGREAVELAKKLEPDIVMMDIKMPGMDGVEAVKRIQEEQPKIKFIMVSAFNTFDYAQQVMRFGVKEYLLKPSKKSDILAAIDRMINEIEKLRSEQDQKKKLTNRLERISSFVQTESIVYLLMDHIQEVSLSEWSEWLNIEGKEGYALAFSFEHGESEINRSVKLEWYNLLKDVIHMEMNNSLVGPMMGLHVPVFMLIDEASTDRKEIDRIVLKIIHKFKNLKQTCRLTAGVGSMIKELDHFVKSYEEALLALEFVHSNKAANYLIYDEQLKKKREQLIPMEKEKKLLEAIKEGSEEDSLRLFDQYYYTIVEVAYSNVGKVKMSVRDLFVVISRMLKEIGIDLPFQYEFHSVSTVTQVKEFAKSQLVFVIKEIKEWRQNDMKGLLVQAKEYIDRNFNKVITLDDAADFVGLSSFYFSKLFKERFQMTFIDYLTHLRVTKAKELLNDQTVTLKKIAIEVGYRDPNYFSRVYKKTTGESPSEYRANYFKVR